MPQKCRERAPGEVVKSPQNTLEYRPAMCAGCGRCAEVCPHGVFAQEGNAKATIVSHDKCMECGACMLNCPVDAISVDSGVGCASAMIWAALTGKKNPSCGGDSPSCG